MNQSSITVETKVTAKTQQGARAKHASHLRRLACTVAASLSTPDTTLGDFLVKRSDIALCRSWQDLAITKAFITESDDNRYPPVFLNVEAVMALQDALNRVADDVEYGKSNVVAASGPVSVETYWLWELSDPCDLYLKDGERPTE